MIQTILNTAIKGQWESFGKNSKLAGSGMVSLRHWHLIGGGKWGKDIPHWIEVQMRKSQGFFIKH